MRFSRASRSASLSRSDIFGMTSFLVQAGPLVTPALSHRRSSATSDPPPCAAKLPPPSTAPAGGAPGGGREDAAPPSLRGKRRTRFAVCIAPYARVLWPETTIKSEPYAGRRVSQIALKVADASATSENTQVKLQHFRRFALADT